MQGAIVKVQLGGDLNIRAVHEGLHAVENMKEVHILAGPDDVLCHVEAADVDAIVNT